MPAARRKTGRTQQRRTAATRPPARPVRRPAAAAPAAPTRRAQRAAPEPEELEDDDEPFEAGEEEEEEGFLDDEDLPEVIDLSEAEDTYAVVPRGIYEGWIDEVEYGRSQSTNKPMLTARFKFNYDAEDGKGEKERTLSSYLILQGDGSGRAKKTISRLLPEVDLTQIRPFDLAEELQGLEVRARVTIRPDRDDPKTKRNNIADLMPIDEDEFA